MWHFRFIGAAACTFALAAGCHGADFDVKNESEQMVEAVTPPAASVLRDSGIVRSPTGGFSRLREIRSGVAWVDYLEWVDGRFMPGYRRVQRSAENAAYIRNLPGDRLELDVAKLGQGPTQAVKITFLASPD